MLNKNSKIHNVQTKRGNKKNKWSQTRWLVKNYNKIPRTPEKVLISLKKVESQHY